MNNQKRETNMKKFKNGIIWFSILLVVGALAGYVLYTSTENISGFDSGMFSSLKFWGPIAVILMIALIIFLNKLMASDGTAGSHSSRQGTTSTGKKMNAYFSARLVTREELRTNKDFHFCYFSNLGNVKFDGIPLRAERIGNHTEINMEKPIHTLIIGTTGSGKTTMFVDPTIQILANCGTHPSMVMSDPKGELYTHNATRLKQLGYDVQCIDLRNPNQSSRVNPIEPAFINFQRAHNLTKEVKVFQGPFDPKRFEPVRGATYGDKWYVFENVAFPSIEILKEALETKKQELINSAFEDIQDVALTLCPPANGDNSFWVDSARDFIRAIMMAMLEDSLDPKLEMTKEKFNLYNVSKIASLRDFDGGDDNIKSLKEYFSGRDERSEAVKLASSTIATAAVTAKGILSHVTQSMNMFDQSIGSMTSSTDLDFSQFADKPTALFIVIPDEKDTRHGLANIYITQLYKALIARANQDKINITLPRHVYFLLDEFGNLPKIAKMKSFITAGRSRGIFLALVVQDYTQLASVYGEQDAATIKNNCNIQIYIGTKDQKTREEFSKNIGETTLEMKNTQISTNTTPGQQTSNGTYSRTTTSTNKSTSTNLVNVPLISANELDHLAPYEVVINSFHHYSMRTIFTPSYKNPEYQFLPAESGFVVKKPFYEDKIYYDIKKRNQMILHNDDGDDDFDFDFSKFKRN